MSGQEKFDNCRHRSLEAHPILGTAFVGCGSCFKGATVGFFCWKKEITNVVPELCEVCTSFQSKDFFQNVE